jgi:N-methylhydantoinase A
VRTAYRLAVAHMAEEIMDVAVRHGVDPRDFGLVAYGAAGPMLLPAALELLPLKEVVVPPYPGLFSALGLLSTDMVYYDSRSAYVVLGPDTAGQVDAVLDEMERRLRDRVGAVAAGLPVRRSFDGRLLGQSWETPFVQLPDGPIDAATVGEVIARFHDAYEARNGNRFEYIPVEGVTYRVELVVPSEKVEHVAHDAAAPSVPAPERTIALEYLGDEPLEAAEHRREKLAVGAVVRGPAVIREDLSTTFVLPGQRATVGRVGELVIERDEEQA